MKSYWLLIMAIFTAGCSTINPIRKSDLEITQALLREKPMGTKRSEIERWLVQDKKLKPTSSPVGFYRTNPTPSRTVGAKSVHARLGEYLSFPPLDTVVEAYWGFDDKDELIDVWVVKSVDAP